MNIKLASLSGFLLVVACGGSDRPAQNPSMSSTTAATPETTTTTTPSTTQTDSYKPSEGTTTMSGATGASNPAPAAPPAPPPATNTPNNAGGAAVIDNPGVANQTKNADNTKINDRDRHDTVTPQNTGNKKSDVELTAAIRRAVMADKSLSFTAKNVKIVVTGSKVTLRGVVKTDAEKDSIASLAQQQSGVTEVDNQIEVKK